MSRRDEFLTRLNQSDYDIVVVTETWLRTEHGMESDKYSIYRRDRVPNCHVKHGGGVLIAVKKCLEHSLVELNDCSLEQLCLRIRLGKTELFVVGIYLRPAGDVECYNRHAKSVQQLLEQISGRPAQVLIVGDYNLPHITWNNNVPAFSSNPSKTIKKKGEIILRMKEELNLFQKNYIRNRKRRMLDLVFVNNSDNFKVVRPPLVLRKCDQHHKPLIVEFQPN